MYIGSAYDLRKRLGTYFFPSSPGWAYPTPAQDPKGTRLLDNIHISNSILRHGHSSFSLVILLDLGITGTVSNKYILHNE